jgi:hypothetical protein
MCSCIWDGKCVFALLQAATKRLDKRDHRRIYD